MSTDAFEQLIDVAAPGGGSYPVQRGHRRGVRSPHTFDAARWPPSSLTSPYAPQGSTTAVLACWSVSPAIAVCVLAAGFSYLAGESEHVGPAFAEVFAVLAGELLAVAPAVVVVVEVERSSAGKRTEQLALRILFAAGPSGLYRGKKLLALPVVLDGLAIHTERPGKARECVRLLV